MSAPASSSRREAALSAAALAAWIGLMIAASPPWTAVPVGDDWIYAGSVKTLLSTARLRVSEFAAPTALTHILWGTLFCLPAGFSQAALRTSTLAAAGLALFFFERLLAELGQPPSRRRIGAALLALNPLFVSAALSFYTDAFFLAAFLLSALGVLKGSRRWLWAASAASIAATLARQIGLAPAAAGAVWRWRRGDRGGAMILLVPPLAALAAHSLWFTRVHGVTHAAWYHAHESLARLASPAALAKDALFRFSAAVALIGLAVFPLGASAAFSPSEIKRPASSRAVVLAAVAAAWAAALAAGLLPPRLGDELWFGGLGPAAVPGAAFKTAGWWGWRALWNAADAASLLALLGLAATQAPAGGTIFLAAASALAFAPAFLSFSYYDRYVLVLLPAAIAAGLDAAAENPRAAWLGAALMGILSWCGARDAASWNAALWRAAAKLESLGYCAEEIRGGLSWDGAHEAEKNIAILRRTTPLSQIKPYAWLELEHPRALLTFDPRPPRGTRRLFVERYPTPLSLGGGAIYADALEPGVRPP